MSFASRIGNSEVRGDFTRLNRLVKNLRGKNYVDVGILGDVKEARGEGLTTASIMAVHEFGSIQRSIPERSWLRMPLETGSRNIESQVAPKIESLLEEGDVKGVFKLLGIACEARIQDAFETGGFGNWPELSDSTIDAKGSDAILIDTGQARQAVTSKVGGKP